MPEIVDGGARVVQRAYPARQESVESPRPAVSVPAVMVSTAMQGGCTCENAPYLRIGAGNIDIAALAAPRPLGMLAAHDWTQELMTKGFPDLKKLYTILGIPDRVAAFVAYGADSPRGSWSCAGPPPPALVPPSPSETMKTMFRVPAEPLTFR